MRSGECPVVSSKPAASTLLYRLESLLDMLIKSLEVR